MIKPIDAVFRTRVSKWIRNPVFVLFVLSLSFRIAFDYFLFPKPIIAADSVSYIAASQEISGRLLQGIPDEQRTPLYPAILALSRFFAGEEKQFIVVVLFQRLLSLLSVYFFYRTANLLIKNRRIALTASLYYACFPAVLSYNASILTESPAVSLTVIVFYWIVSSLDSNGYGRTVCAGLSVFFLVMLRPAFFCLLPILSFFSGHGSFWSEKPGSAIRSV